MKLGLWLEELQAIPRRNAVRLSKLSSEVQAASSIIEVSKGPEKAFVATVMEKHSDQHIEQERKVVGSFTRPAGEELDSSFATLRQGHQLSCPITALNPLRQPAPLMPYLVRSLNADASITTARLRRMSAPKPHERNGLAILLSSLRQSV